MRHPQKCWNIKGNRDFFQPNTDLEPYGYTLDMNYAIVVKTNGEVCQNWLAGENVMTLTVKLGDYQKLGWSGDWLCADGHL